MFFKQFNNNSYVIRVKRGERIIRELTEFCKSERIEGGFFYGLGAVNQAELAHYNVQTQKYSSKKYTQAWEMTNITGSVGLYENEIIVHAHASFSDSKMHEFGGHLVEATVSGTAEIYFTVLPKMEKIIDLETGLKVFKI
jgi:uncharacterized protein